MRRIGWLAVWVAVLAALATGALWWQTQRTQALLRQQVLHEAGERSRHLAEAIAGQVEAFIGALDLALQELVRHRLEDTPDAFAAVSDEILAALPRDLVHLLTVVDRDGHVAFNSRGAVSVYVGDREHFQRQRAGEGGHGLFISGPLRSRVTGEWMFVVGRPVVRGGRFDGTVHLVVSTAFLSARLAAHQLHEQDVVALLHPDGSFLAASRRLAQVMGQRVPADRPYMRPDAPASGSATILDDHDGRWRTFGWRTLPDTGMRLVIGLDEAALLAPLQPVLARERTSEVVHMVLLFGGGLLIAGLIWRVERAQQVLHRLNGQLERRVAERTAELEALNGELETFAYTVSHDLRTPLRSIHGYAHLLETEEWQRLSEDGRAHLRCMQAAARRMSRLITQLLAMAQVERATLRMETLDLSAMAHAVADELARNDPARRVHWDIEEGLRAVGDPALVHSVLQNLLGNAWKYTSRMPEARVSLRHVASGEGMHTFCVRDNGAGFDAADVDRLFRPFERLHEDAEFEGTGVGLATVKRIVQRHGGQVGGEGAVGRGAAVWFSLPAAPA
jgi:signal transduction histidine kinase